MKCTLVIRLYLHFVTTNNAPRWFYFIFWSRIATTDSPTSSFYLDVVFFFSCKSELGDDVHETLSAVSDWNTTLIAIRAHLWPSTKIHKEIGFFTYENILLQTKAKYVAEPKHSFKSKKCNCQFWYKSPRWFVHWPHPINFHTETNYIHFMVHRVDMHFATYIIARDEHRCWGFQLFCSNKFIVCCHKSGQDRFLSLILCCRRPLAIFDSVTTL